MVILHRKLTIAVESRQGTRSLTKVLYHTIMVFCVLVHVLDGHDFHYNLYTIDRMELSQNNTDYTVHQEAVRSQIKNLNALCLCLRAEQKPGSDGDIILWTTFI